MTWRERCQASGDSKTLAGILLCGLFAIGAYLRLNGIFVWPVSDDEYYSTTAVLRILEMGLPVDHCDGLYFRAPLFHYLAAAVAWPMTTDMVPGALRIVSSIASLITAPALLLIGRRMGSPFAGLLASALFLLSVWEIEFARFARMYALFACVAVWQVFYVQRYADTNRERDFYIAVVLALLGALSWAGGIFLVALPALAWWLKSQALPWRKLMVLVGSALLAIIARVLPQALSSPGPPSTAGAASAGMLINPFGDRLAEPYMVTVPLVFCLVMLIAGLLFRKQLSEIMDAWPDWLALGLIATSTAAGLALASVIVFSIYSLRDDAHNRSEKLWIFGGVLLAGVLLWTVAHLLYGTGPKGIAVLLFDYPDVWRRFLVPWFEVMPIWTAMLLAGTGVLFASSVLRPHRTSDGARLFLCAQIVLVSLATAINTDYIATRYTFFVYPLLLVAAALPLAWMIMAMTRRFPQPAAATAICVAIFVASEDHSLRPLVSINDYHHTFRIDYSSALANHYYPKSDYRAAAEYINVQARNGDLVIATHQAQSFYLDNIDYIFKGESSLEYPRVVCRPANIDRWTGKPVLGSIADVVVATASADPSASVWILTRTVEHAPTQHEKQFSSVLGDQFVHVTPDSRLAVAQVDANNLPGKRRVQ